MSLTCLSFLHPYSTLDVGNHWTPYTTGENSPETRKRFWPRFLLLRSFISIFPSCLLHCPVTESEHCAVDILPSTFSRSLYRYPRCLWRAKVTFISLAKQNWKTHEGMQMMKAKSSMTALLIATPHTSITEEYVEYSAVTSKHRDIHYPTVCTTSVAKFSFSSSLLFPLFLTRTKDYCISHKHDSNQPNAPQRRVPFLRRNYRCESNRKKGDIYMTAHRLSIHIQFTSLVFTTQPDQTCTPPKYLAMVG